MKLDGKQIKQLCILSTLKIKNWEFISCGVEGIFLRPRNKTKLYHEKRIITFPKLKVGL